MSSCMRPVKPHPLSPYLNYLLLYSSSRGGSTSGSGMELYQRSSASSQGFAGDSLNPSHHPVDDFNGQNKEGPKEGGERNGSGDNFGWGWGNFSGSRGRAVDNRDGFGRNMSGVCLKSDESFGKGLDETDDDPVGESKGRDVDVISSSQCFGFGRGSGRGKEWKCNGASSYGRQQTNDYGFDKDSFGDNQDNSIVGSTFGSSGGYRIERRGSEFVNRNQSKFDGDQAKFVNNQPDDVQRGARAENGRHVGSFSGGYYQAQQNNDSQLGTEFGNLKISRATYKPKDRSLDELYGEDEYNAKYEINDLDLDVNITGVPASLKSLKFENWTEADFEQVLYDNIVEKCHYTSPRRIQAAVIPLIKRGWDLLGHAETGSGKTLAFVLPIIDQILKDGPPADTLWAPIALILAPTRELAAQLYDQVRKVVYGTNVTVARCYGRIDIRKNMEDINRGCDILVATCGRLVDFIQRGRVRVQNIKYLVLDEADKMLEAQGFRDDMLQLTNFPYFPNKQNRQTLLFSATFDTEVQMFAREILKDKYAFVSNGKITSANPRVQQNFVQVTQASKLGKLCEILDVEQKATGDVSRTLVFVTRKIDADTVAMFLSAKNIRSCSIHGDREQSQREAALKEFRDGVTKVLIATDVCARGIDVPDIEHVINYDLPTEWIMYVHRIGRTGRLHNGKATTFLNPTAQLDCSMAPHLMRLVHEVQQEVPQFLVDMAGGMGSFLDTGHAAGHSGFTSDGDWNSNQYAEEGATAQSNATNWMTPASEDQENMHWNCASGEQATASWD